MNQRQVVIALTGGELVYFEMDPVCGFKTAESFDVGTGGWVIASVRLESLMCPQSRIQ